jgi:hypothetical protein
MFVHITRADGRSYVKIMEAFRDDRGATRQRIIATLGRLEHVRAGGADALVRGLMRVSGTAAPEAPMATSNSPTCGRRKLLHLK